MTLSQPIPSSVSAGRSRITMAWGGAGFVIAGALLAIGGLPFALGSAPEGLASVWLLLLWPVGGIALLVASIVLAVGLPADDGLVGRAVGPRAALIASGAGPLLLVVAFLSSWSVAGLAIPVAAMVQLLSFATTAVVAVTVVRHGTVSGAARWVFAVLAVVDAVALVLAVVPQTALAFQVVVAIVRPLAVIVTGAVLMAQGRSLRAGSRPRADA